MPFLNNGPWNSSLHPRDSRGEFRYNGGRHRRSALIPIQPGPKIVIPPHPPNADIDANMRRMRALEFLSPNGKYPAFYLLVRTNGPWGYKNQPSHGANPQYDAFGNLNYGAAGTAAGIDSYTLQNEAGRAQTPGTDGKGKVGRFWDPKSGVPPYGDRPADNYWIKQGILYAHQHGY